MFIRRILGLSQLEHSRGGSSRDGFISSHPGEQKAMLGDSRYDPREVIVGTLPSADTTDIADSRGVIPG